MSREDLERAVIDAAVEWFGAEERGGFVLLFDPTQAALVVAVEALNNAPTAVAYEDRDGDVWYESRERPGHWCLSRECDGTRVHRALTDVHETWGPLKEVPDDRV